MLLDGAGLSQASIPLVREQVANSQVGEVEQVEQVSLQEEEMAGEHLAQPHWSGSGQDRDTGQPGDTVLPGDTEQPGDTVHPSEAEQLILYSQVTLNSQVTLY